MCQFETAGQPIVLLCGDTLAVQDCQFETAVLHMAVVTICSTCLNIEKSTFRHTDYLSVSCDPTSKQSIIFLIRFKPLVLVMSQHYV